MKKQILRFFQFLLLFAFITCFSVAFSACEEQTCEEGHTWEEEILRAATCTEDGEVHKHCTVCNADFTDVIPATGHTFSDEVVTIQPTCTKAGEAKRTCTVCNSSFTDVIPATGHSFSERVITSQPTCTKQGQSSRTCSVCGEMDVTRIPTIPHTYEETSHKDATCVLDGEVVLSCSMCGITTTEVLPALGHKKMVQIEGWKPTCVREGSTTQYSCSRCGLVLEPATSIPKVPHTYSHGVCTGCGGEKTLKAQFVVGNVIIKTVTFTVSTKEKVMDEMPDVPERDGYRNGRWDLFTVGDTDLTIYAHYDRIEYPVSYEGERGAKNPNPTTYTVESDITLRPLSLDGYRFEGWYIGDRQVTSLPDGELGEKQLTARWTIIQYSITYEGILDPSSIDLPTAYTVETGAIELKPPAPDGRTFLGWMLNGEYVDEIPAGTLGDLTIRAVYERVVFRVKLDAAGGTANKSYVDVEYGEDYKLPVPVMKGHTFLGWFSNSGTSGIQFTSQTGNCIKPYHVMGDVILYAHWESILYTVKYDSMGGDPVRDKTYAYGEAFVPAETENPNGYLLDGWYNSDFTVKYTESTLITEDMTVYARWVESTPISTAEALLAIADAPDKHYHLTQDINLKGAVWTPIEQFTGTLLGNGYTIKNFIISATSSVENLGFININKGTVEDLTFQDIVFSVAVRQPTMGTNGGIVAATNEGAIRGCKVSGGSFNLSFTKTNAQNCTYDLKFGEIAGYQGKNGITENCSASIDITPSLHVSSGGNNSVNMVLNLYLGGLVGFNVGTVTQSNYIGTVKSTNYGYGTTAGLIGQTKIRGRSIPYIGGVVGCNSDGGNIQKCYSDVNFNVESKTEGSEGYVIAYVGGLCGSNTGKGTNIAWCYSKGKIEGSGVDTTNFGGFVGLNTTDAVISSCYSMLVLIGTDKGEYGGFVGKNQAIIKNCYATGNVSCTGTDSSTCLGGFVGHATSSSNISMCYSTGDVQSEGGSADFFVGLSDSASSLYKVYYLHGVTVTLNGVILNKVSEYGTSKELGELWSEEFLVSDLYWDEEGWIILFDEDPILEWETTVSHDYVTYIVEPTCVDFGYTVYVCRDCSRIFVRNYTSPLGHKYDYDHPVVVDPTCTEMGHIYYHCLNEEDSPLYDLGETTPSLGGHKQGEILASEDPTCTEDGYIRATCTVCEEEYTKIVPAKGHTPPEDGDDGNAVVGSCTGGVVIMNKTASITCSVCGETIREAVESSPHQYLVDEERSTEPTCTEPGTLYRSCVLCHTQEEITLEPTGHTVMEGTARCVACQKFIFDAAQIKKIGSVQDLKDISKDMGGIYMLSKNIDLSAEDWTPLGSAAKPFTGWLFGGGYKIVSLTVRDQKNGGLFAVNRGYLVGITMENGYIYGTDVEGASCGLLAGINYGQIINCSVTGNVLFSLSVHRVVKDFETHFTDFENFVGGIAGTNSAYGTIEACKVSATIGVSLLHTMTNAAEIDWRYYLTRQWKTDIAESLAAFYVGGIVGLNRGRVADCTASGSMSASCTQEIDLRHPGKIPTLLGDIDFKYNAGSAKTVMNTYAANIVGYNTGTVEACTTDGAHLRVAVNGVNSTNGRFFRIEMDMNDPYSYEMDGKAVGKNDLGGEVL